MTEFGNEIVSHKERLKEIQDEVSVFHSTESISASPGGSNFTDEITKGRSQ